MVKGGTNDDSDDGVLDSQKVGKVDCLKAFCEDAQKEQTNRQIPGGLAGVLEKYGSDQGIEQGNNQDISSVCADKTAF